VGDVLRAVAKNPSVSLVKARDIMSSPVITFDEETDIQTLARIFKERALTRGVLVNASGAVVGIVRDKDIYKYLRFSKLDQLAREVFESQYFHNVY
ncbi:hypothetical protein COY95_00710, partial [Candidatus Woesearchaeota archaeon CG_4_10_14_0_8_um_filter_47_5]